MSKTLRMQFCLMAAASLLSVAAVDAAPLQYISVTGEVVADNSRGTLVGYIGQTFTYEASYQLDTGIATDIGTNDGGWTVYELNDGGVRYQNSAILSGGDWYYSNYVLFEFNDDLVENWQSELGWIGLDASVQDGDALDAIVLGFHDPDIPDEIQFYVTLLFENDLFTGYDALPQSIDLTQYLGGAGEFCQYSMDLDDWQGFAQFKVNAGGVSVMTVSSPVPEPGSMFLFATGLAGLAGLRRRKKERLQ